MADISPAHVPSSLTDPKEEILGPLVCVPLNDGSTAASARVGTLDDDRRIATITARELGKVRESLERIDKGISDLTSSISGLAARKRNPRDRDRSSDSKATVEDREDEVINPPKDPAKFTPEVRYCNSHQFKNRYGVEEGAYAMEVLIGGASAIDHLEPQTHPAMHLDPKSLQLGKNTWIHRVRINSPAIMRVLGSVNGDQDPWDGKPRCFSRPFRYFIRFQSKMEEEVKKMEEKVAQAALQSDGTSVAVDGDFGNANSRSRFVQVLNDVEKTGTDKPAEPVSETSMDDSSKEETAVTLETIYSSNDALEDVKCYVKFVKEKLLPDYHQFDGEISSKTKVRFDDLWYLFQIGDLVHIPSSPKEAHIARSSTQQTTWRIYSSRLEPLIFHMYCYYIDFDGESYGAVSHLFSIEIFKGEREVVKLSGPYPLRFMKDWEASLSQLETDGARVVDCITRRYGYYSGWTITKTPAGDELQDLKSNAGNMIKSPDHIESEVLVDYTEAFNAAPSWKPELTKFASSNLVFSSEVEKITIKTWGSLATRELLNSREDILITDDGIDEYDLNDLIKREQFLEYAGDAKPSPPTSQRDLALLPKRIFAYAVWARKFVNIDSRYLKPANEKGKEDKTFNKLEIDPRNKRMIESLVHAHFLKKKEGEDGIEFGSQDLIRGKGRGVVILLHGVPGVGKTATAEAVAQKWNKPLFPITCGDLGFTPESVEKSLSDIFRLAHLWDCVLLLDEADVFITQRDKQDLQRNALVSIFLRMLEYYNGILFLTTNRGGVLDEAVKSRVHLNLKYESLNLYQTMRIFELNIERLEEIEEQRSKAKGHRKLIVVKKDVLEFAETHFNKYENSNGIGRWNGRQIRNAFLIASSLAHYEGESQPELQTQLRSSHFNLVDETTILYDNFRSNVLGGADDAIAYDRMERDAPMPPPVRRSSAQVPLAQGQNFHGGQGYPTQQATVTTSYTNTASNFHERGVSGAPRGFRSHSPTYMEELGGFQAHTKANMGGGWELLRRLWQRLQASREIMVFQFRTRPPR
ncbi:hypothetical protein ACLOAV_002645 [Pseudogymnoascus australis]